ncbi:hypothetical protein DFH09DRAFT_1311618 [Mycena vulgaris]|nr:hypothetical protein DFH09DRAFT_1311618 [Mycena vulgaris]
MTDTSAKHSHIPYNQLPATKPSNDIGPVTPKDPRYTIRGISPDSNEVDAGGHAWYLDGPTLLLLAQYCLRAFLGSLSMYALRAGRRGRRRGRPLGPKILGMFVGPEVAVPEALWDVLCPAEGVLASVVGVLLLRLCGMDLLPLLDYTHAARVGVVGGTWYGLMFLWCKMLGYPVSLCPLSDALGDVV